jgi:hypothetical protein
MFYVKRITHIIIIPAVNKNTPPWSVGVSQAWASKGNNPMTPEALFLQGSQKVMIGVKVIFTVCPPHLN